MPNRFKPAFRFLWKHKSFSLLNIVGLAVGIAASLLIFLVISNETSFDMYHPDVDRLYRVVTQVSNSKTGEVVDNNPGVPLPFPAAFRHEFPQVEAGAIARVGQAQIYVPDPHGGEEKRFKEASGIFWVEPQFFNVMPAKWLQGSPARLKEPNTVVVEESFAKRYFGSAPEAIGKTVQIWSFRIPLQVVGVYEDLPDNTDFPVAFGGSFETFLDLSRKRSSSMLNWDIVNGNTSCVIKLPAHAAINSLSANMPGFSKKYDATPSENRRAPMFQPISSMHLDPDFRTFVRNRLSKKELWSLGLIGTFLLIVACINFINLSTAQSVNRSKEIGVRKVLGSNRRQLVIQFLAETAIITFFALIIGILLTYATLPMISRIMEKNLSLDLFHRPLIWIFLLFTGMLVTLLAGFYPAIVLSGFQPAQIFKRKSSGRNSGGIYLRRALVVFQFVIAQLLIIGTIVVVKQMKYFRDKPIGMSKDNIVLINLPSDSSLQVRYPLLVSRIQAVRGVQSASLCMDAPANGWQYQEDLYVENEDQKRPFPVTRQFADTGYYRTFGMKLIAGRFPFASDSTVELVVNETLVKKIGVSDNQHMIGKMLSFDGQHRYMVVGVIGDFNNLSLRDALAPLVISSEYYSYEWIAVRTEAQGSAETLGRVHETFASIYPTYMFDQVYFDEQIAGFYQGEAMTSQLFKLFSTLAILISCLGLYGLISFMAVQKTREVGIRKVLGASVNSIIYLFSREFTLLIGIAFLIATPVGYFLMKEWLDNFYYHITLGWIVFGIAILSTLIIAWASVGYRAYRAAVVNPVKSLKAD